MVLWTGGRDLFDTVSFLSLQCRPKAEETVDGESQDRDFGGEIYKTRKRLQESEQDAAVGGSRLS